MIALLRGVVALQGAGHVVVDCGGVGYLVHTPARTAADLVLDGAVTLHVATVVREDAITLYGFHTVDERDTFGILREVSGIGPKAALSLLGHLDVTQLSQAIQNDDLRALTQVPGIGRKTASRLCLELKSKLSVSFTPSSPSPRPTAPSDPLPLALARLDYRKTEIDQALASPDVPDPEAAPLDERLRAAIGVLSRPR